MRQACWHGTSEEMETAITLLVLIMALLVSAAVALVVGVFLLKGFLHVIYVGVDRVQQGQLTGLTWQTENATDQQRLAPRPRS
jgi:hypothetical protein